MLEFLSEQLQKTKLFEMAASRAKAEEIIYGLNQPIYYHLIKILYWKDKINYEKHIKDINSWLFKIDSIVLKPNNKKVSEKDLYIWLFDEMYGNGHKHLQKIIDKHLVDYHNLQKSGITVESLYFVLEHIYKRISKDISNDNFNTIKDYI